MSSWPKLETVVSKSVLESFPEDTCIVQYGLRESPTKTHVRSGLAKCKRATDTVQQALCLKNLRESCQDEGPAFEKKKNSNKNCDKHNEFGNSPVMGILINGRKLGMKHEIVRHRFRLRNVTCESGPILQTGPGSWNRKDVFFILLMSLKLCGHPAKCTIGSDAARTLNHCFKSFSCIRRPFNNIAIFQQTLNFIR